MAETHHALLLPETDAISLREALHGQQQILQKLYRELDVEREAAATAASEAMSMILRLQGEKAALKMEASQYKRMAEEKMCHAEETLALCDDLMYQKEMEIASLEFQLQSCRNRLVSMGPNDAPELDFSPHKSDALFGEKVSATGGLHSNVRRLNSLPQLGLMDSTLKKVGFDRKQIASTSTTIDEEAEYQEIHELEKKLVSGHTAGDLNSYWEQIKRLDERLKEISDGSSKDHASKNKSALWRGGTWSHSQYSQLTGGNSDNNSGENSTSQDLEVGLSSHVSSNYGIADNLESQKPSEQRKKASRKPHVEAGNEFIKQETSSGEQVKTILHCSSSNEKKKAPKDAPFVDHGGLPRSPATAHHPLVTPCDYQKLMRRIERLERGNNNVRQQKHDNVSCGGGQTAEEEMHLLKVIQEQLSGIQTELRSRKAQKPIVPDEPCLDVLQEVMLYFWL